MMFRRRLPYDSSELAGLREEKTSLQPLAAEILPPRKARTSTGGSLVVGVVIGVALSLPITTWAVRTHRWPGQGPVGDTATPATPMCPTQLPASPPLVAASALPIAPPETAVVTCDREIASALAAAAEKAKRRKHKGVRPGVHAGTSAAPAPEEPSISLEEQAAAELADSLR
jgi:hypothetical protein